MFIQLALPFTPTLDESVEWLHKQVVSGYLCAYSPGVRLALCETDADREVLTWHVVAVKGWVEDGRSPQTCYVRLPDGLPLREWDVEMLERRRNEHHAVIETMRESHPLAFTEGGHFSVYRLMLHYSKIGATWRSGGAT